MTTKSVTGKKNNEINLILLFCGVRTANFGQGTFINNLLSCFGANDIKVFIIKTDASDVKQVKIDRGEFVDTLTIPQPENKLYLNSEDTPIQKIYARRIVDIVLPYIKDLSNPVFLTNSIDYLNVCEYIKENFEGPKVMYVHHSWSWKYRINVSDTEFARQWKKGNINLHPTAFELTGYQQRIMEISDLVVAVTNQARKFMKEVLFIRPDKIKMIYNGVDEPLSNSISKLDLKKKYGIDPKQKVIIYSGRIKEDKGIRYLIEAFKILATRSPDVKLLIVGHGDIMDFIPIIEPFWNRIVFTGGLDFKTVSELYSLADLGVLPSLHEQCSFTAIEMRLHRLPIIVTSVDGLDEVFEDGVDALKLRVTFNEKKIKTLCSNELSEKMNVLLNDQSLCRTLTENSHRKAKELFDLEKMGTLYVEAIKSLF